MPQDTASPLRARAPYRLTGLELAPATVVLEPIVTVFGGELFAVEALTRFTAATVPTDETFAHAHAAGRGEALEAACLEAAFAARDQLPDGVLLSVNVSPRALLHPAVRAVLDVDLRGILIEITEQPLLDVLGAELALAELRRRGALVAVDDAGAGYAGLQRLVSLRPDVVKLDRSLITGARRDRDQISVVSALINLSHRLGSVVVGEGVETFDDLAMLAELDVEYAQGRAIALAAPTLEPIAAAVITACRATRSELLKAESPLAVGRRAQALHRVISELAGAALVSDIGVALGQAGTILGVDRIAVWMLEDGLRLRELRTSPTSAAPYPAALQCPTAPHYRLVDHPAIGSALRTGSLVEAHVEDEGSADAERLRQRGLASSLIVPLYAQGLPVAVLEFDQRERRRWSVYEITRFRMLSDHVAQALARLMA